MKNKIKELKGLGCLVSIDLSTCWSNESKDCIRKLESNNLIDVVTGFSKFENLNEIINKFSSDSKIEDEKLQKIYMYENPNLILESSNK